MAIFQGLRELRTSESVIGNVSAYARWLAKAGNQRTNAGVRVTEQSALQLPYVYACINVLAQTVAQAPLELKRRDGKTVEPATDHPLYDIVRHRPSLRHDAFRWKQALEGHRAGWGNAICLIDRSDRKRWDLVPLMPDRTTVEMLDDDGSLVYRSTLDNGKQIQVGANDVLHFAGLGYDGIKGYTPIKLAAESVGLGLAIHEFGAKFFGTGLNPHGVIESDVPANGLIKWAADFKQKYGSLANSHDTPILPRGLTYKPITINPDDAQTLETLNFNRTEICSIYRVPPHFVMDLSRSTFTNATEMNHHFLMHTMVPIFCMYEAELDTKLLTEAERRAGLHFKFSADNLMRGLALDRAQFYHYSITDGWMSRAEVREREGLPYEEGLDEFVISTGTMAGESSGTGDIIDSLESEPEEPVARSFAERLVRMESNEVAKALKGDPAKSLPPLYLEKIPQFCERNLLPIARMVDFEPRAFVELFANEYRESLAQEDPTTYEPDVEHVLDVYRKVKHDRASLQQRHR